MAALVESINLSKVYTDMAEPVWVLKGIDFSLSAGETVGIFGASGAGKSTLLHLLGGIDTPTSGEVRADGKSLQAMGAREIASYRNRRVGFVFQFYHLLAEFTALENVMLPALIAGQGTGEARRLATEALEAMGLSERMDHRPAMLSGGEQQRVALARAAVMRPPMILADEPTGNLDPETGEQIFSYLLRVSAERAQALVIVSHNRDLLARLPRVFELCEGKLHQLH